MAGQAYTVVVSDSEEEKHSPTFPEAAIGIDIGTSQCRAAFWNGSQVELFRNTVNQKMMRSYVTFKDEVPSGGVSSQLDHEYEVLSGATIFNMKRLIGRVDTDPVVHASKSLPFFIQTLDIGVRPLIAALASKVWRTTTLEEVLAIFLLELKALAEVRLNRPVTNVVLTVPVSFSRFQLSRIERACAMVGLRILRLMPEPTAVALLYTQQQQKTLQGIMGTGSDKIVLIFNMGAGYSDVAVSATSGGVSQIKALAGNTIGGEDILQNMMHYLLPNMESLFSTHGIYETKSMGILRIATQDAMHKFSSQDTVKLNIDLGNGTRICKIVDRKEFEEVNRVVFEECEKLIIQCLCNAKVEIGGVDDVILVGGCSNIPKIRNIVKDICQREEIYPDMNTLEAAVCGAALEGAVASGISNPFGRLDLLTIQVIPMSIGIRADGNTFVPIVHKNTTMPVRKDLNFTTVHDNQLEALLVVYEGEEVVVQKNHLLGFFKITGIPPAPKGVPQIQVGLDIGASNVLRVLAGVVMPAAQYPVNPFMEVRMPTVDGGHGWCTEALLKTYGSSLDLVTLQKKLPQ